jgi:hypothetical protein
MGILRDGVNQRRHPECCMVHKYWNVRLANDRDDVTTPDLEAMETIVKEILTTLSGFEETSVSHISDYVLHAGYVPPLVALLRKGIYDLCSLDVMTTRKA